MNEILESIEKAIKNENWHVALISTLVLPDICGKIESPKEISLKRYVSWFNGNMPEYHNYLLGEDCYALRCALLHEGTDDLTQQRIKRVLEHIVFISKESAHLVLFKDCDFDGVKETFLQLNVTQFCEDMCTSVKKWMQNNSTNTDILEKIGETIQIHEPGYVYKKRICFS